MTAAGWFDWLSVLHLEERMLLPDGTRLLAVHVAPGQDDGSGIHPALSDDELNALVQPGVSEAGPASIRHTAASLDKST